MIAGGIAGEIAGGIAVGIGCRRGCGGGDIAALVARAFDMAGLDPASRATAVLYAPDRKRDEPGVGEAATRLALPLRFLDHAALAAQQDRVATRSARVAAAVGLASVAEAAALAGAGPGGTLVLRRLTGERATCTCALARSPEPLETPP
jgi:cobalt-precorrin 5A hydrolase